MVKIHSRQKRKHNLNTRAGHSAFFKKKKRASGIKTFSTKELAEKYAKAQGVKDYSIEPAKKGRRFKIIS